MKGSLVDTSSLGRTLCNINTAQILGHTISAKDKRAAATFIVSRYGKPGSYRGLFALTDQDRAAKSLLLATGETLTTRASKAHIAGEEACRALLTLGIATANIQESLKSATEQFIREQRDNQNEKLTDGYYCCGKCSVALWRHVCAGGLQFSTAEKEKHLRNGLKRLKTCRQQNGRWRAFPFYYTLLALTEMPGKIAREELAFAASACERLIRKSAKKDTVSAVRLAILTRVMSAAT